MSTSASATPVSGSKPDFNKQGRKGLQKASQTCCCRECLAPPAYTFRLCPITLSSVFAASLHTPPPCTQQPWAAESHSERRELVLPQAQTLNGETALSLPQMWYMKTVLSYGRKDDKSNAAWRGVLCRTGCRPSERPYMHPWGPDSGPLGLTPLSLCQIKTRSGLQSEGKQTAGTDQLVIFDCCTTDSSHGKVLG